MTKKNNLTTSWGAPVGDNQNSITAGLRDPTLIPVSAYKYQKK